MNVSTWGRPRIKPEHGLRKLPGARIRIGGAVYGIAAEVVDQAGSVWTMLSAADGSRSAADIVRSVLTDHPDEREDVVLAALQQFADAGYLEDASADDPTVLTDREKERYDRSRLFYRWVDLTPRENSWTPQLRLREARAVVVGLGGTGGTAALALAASGVGTLHCVDGDVVELSNLNRQILYAEADLGRSKVDAAVARLRELNSDITVTGERRTIVGESDLYTLTAESDVLVLCADQPGEIRAWANRACLRRNLPWVDAGYHGPVPSAAAYVPGDGPCYECVWLREYEKWKDDHPDRGYTVERTSGNAVTAIAAGISGQLAAHLALALLTGVPRVEPGQIQGINLVAADHNYLIRHPRHPDCPACREHHG
jgi:molybdopterin/thiamine biosynthesis adenylyltransferase